MPYTAALAIPGATRRAVLQRTSKLARANSNQER
jgi:hypothetical protein